MDTDLAYNDRNNTHAEEITDVSPSENWQQHEEKGFYKKRKCAKVMP